MEREQLVEQLKEQIVDYLNLEEVKPEDIQEDTSLFGDDIGLDSIDSLELIVLIQEEYGIQIDDPKEGRQVLESVNNMADFIQKKTN